MLPDGIFSRGSFSHGKRNPIRVLKNGFSCTNVMLLCSGQYYMRIIAFAHQLYTKYYIDGALQTELGQQTAGER